MPQETATEWLFMQLYEKFEMNGDGREMDKILEQAKEMEKQQIVDAYEKGWIGRTGEEHYNQTYKD